jgi:hypothetical protein
MNPGYNTEPKSSTPCRKVRNILGEEVYTCQLWQKETGVDVSSLPNGLYFVGIKTGSNQTVSIKMVIQK